jgi:hypothetical protein
MLGSREGAEARKQLAWGQTTDLKPAGGAELKPELPAAGQFLANLTLFGFPRSDSQPLRGRFLI